MDAYVEFAEDCFEKLSKQTSRIVKFVENNSRLIQDIIFCYLIAVFILYLYLIVKQKVLNFRRISEKLIQKILVITAHPDDECMFFAPTILSQSGGGDFVRILCLSSGNYDGLGHRRTEELKKSCKILGISSDQIILENDSRLPDHPDITWDEGDVINKILPVIYKLQPNAVITFDSYGISGHKNHKSVSHAVRKLCKEGKIPRVTRVFELENANILRKYISVLDLPFTYMFSDILCISSPWGILKTWRAMCSHWSQLKWFRILYMIFSRYVLFNTLQEIKQGNYVANHS